MKLFRLMALAWVDIFAYYVLWMMMVYLTDVWKLDYTNAAAIINIWSGSILVLPIAFVYIAETSLGNFWLLLLTSLSYMVGLGLLWMSTPPVLAKSSGNCTSYKPECIGDKQKELFYSGLALVAVGMAGHLTSYVEFVKEQAANIFLSISSFSSICRTLLGFFASILIPIVGIIVLTFVKRWATMFGICAIFGMFSVLVFLTGVCSYKNVEPRGSPLTIILRVLFAASSKTFYDRPNDENDFYERRELGANALLPHTESLRCLDKAAIVLPEPTLEQQKKNRWRLCRVTEVEVTKIFIRMIPMWMTFVLCGVVSSVGSTYFLVQATRLNPKLGRVKVPLVMLLWFYDQGKARFRGLFVKISTKIVGNSKPAWRRYVPPIGIAVAMVLSILCCITAAKVEMRRLRIVKSHDLIDKPDERIPMSIFWLLPQFVLLGALDGIRELSVEYIFVDQAPESLLRYLDIFSIGVFGAGIMGSAISVYVVGRVSEKVSKINWFQSTLNKSRLDKYYWVLAALSAVNLVFYVVIAIFYRYQDPKEQIEEPEDGGGEDETEIDIPCCCI